MLRRSARLHTWRRRRRELEVELDLPKSPFHHLSIFWNSPLLLYLELVIVPSLVVVVVVAGVPPVPARPPSAALIAPAETRSSSVDESPVDSLERLVSSKDSNWRIVSKTEPPVVVESSSPLAVAATASLLARRQTRSTSIAWSRRIVLSGLGKWVFLSTCGADSKMRSGVQ
jgi:hypothetical protein